MFVSVIFEEYKAKKTRVIEKSKHLLFGIISKKEILTIGQLIRTKKQEIFKNPSHF